MAVGEICSREVVFARRGETLRVAAQLMREKHVGALAVVDERNGDRTPVGASTADGRRRHRVGIGGSTSVSLSAAWRAEQSAVSRV